MFKSVIGKVVIGGFLLAMVGSIGAGIVSLAWPAEEAHAGYGQGQVRQVALAGDEATGYGQGQEQGGPGQGQGGQGQGQGGPSQGQGQGGQGRGQQVSQVAGKDNCDTDVTSPGGQGRSQGNERGAPSNQAAPQGGSGRGQGQSGQGQGGQGQSGQGTGQSQAVPQGQPMVSEIVEGVVVETDELVVETVDGQTVQVGLGPSSYREGQGFALNVGDHVRVSGYWEADEFKATQVESLDTGDSIVLRDVSGRPMWAGQGRRAGQGQ